MLPMSSLSREFIYFRVENAAGIEDVEVAFVIPGAEPQESDWRPAQWTNASPAGADARILVGPGSEVVLTDGTYQAWLRITGAEERPVLPSGLVPIT